LSTVPRGSPQTLSTTRSILSQSQRILSQATPAEIDSTLLSFARGVSISDAERMLYNMDRSHRQRTAAQQTFMGAGRTLFSSSLDSSYSSDIPTITDEEHQESLRKLRMKYFDN
jgi:hypothetical protein